MSRAVRSVMRAALVPLCIIGCAGPLRAQTAPHDLWTPEVLQKIRDPSTLNLQVVPQTGFVEIFFDSEIGDAKWADSGPPHEVHTGGTIRIHGFLAAPASGGPYPALVLGHGHGGHGDADTARAIAAFGYVVLSISGPNAGLSTGGPRDTEQAWISVEETLNQPSPEVSYLYHYAYAGMRALTVLEALGAVPENPLRIDSTRLGVIGASMGGQFTYYINGVDDRVKAAVAIAVAGDWVKILDYPGAWLYHGLYYYTRDGMPSGQDALNTVSSCSDPTLATFSAYFDPISYAPTQHAPLLTIIGSHDQYFVAPALNTTYDRIQAAAPSPRFIKRLYIAPNGKHDIVNNTNPLRTIVELFGSIHRWLRYSFADGPAPPATPGITMTPMGGWMMFRVSAAAGAAPILIAGLYVASQMDSTPAPACDFVRVPLLRFGSSYIGFVPIGQMPACGPALTPTNVLYFASVTDASGYTVSSKFYYRRSEMTFDSGFTPTIEHWDRDDFPVPPPPMCSALAVTSGGGQ
jgi:cephalosporin-C deacetylase-like acetyl esterase